MIHANLAGEEPKFLFVEDVEGGGGVGRGVFYTCMCWSVGWQVFKGL